ncbi:MAG: DoxX family membrane protein [Candidatus Kerfeldbacteria bacterium]|nr:DoxX family membrane protein [Candidatus Kerfeldbacteria bacterium]
MSAFGKGVIGLLRLSLGWIFLWAFIDKLWGLGYATDAAKSWLNGGSPTTGFLKFGSEGPFADFFQGLAGSAWVDWLFMLGLLGIGIALVLGAGVRIAGCAGALLMVLMWLAVLPKENNPFLDDHTIYFFVFLVLPSVHAGRYVGFGKWWEKTSLVRMFPWLE